MLPVSIVQAGALEWVTSLWSEGSLSELPSRLVSPLEPGVHVVGDEPGMGKEILRTTVPCLWGLAEVVTLSLGF